jgi:2-isopropylmalate synthase
MISDSVTYLKKKGKKVFFDAEHFFDGYKDNPDFAMQTIQTALEAGAECIVLCDTNGGSLPHEIYSIVDSVSKKFSAPLGIHTHNDAGMAVANTIEAVRAGATQVQVTVNGLGERCGNADLCSVLPALALKMNIETVSQKSLKRLTELSAFVDELVDMRHNSRAPYVGMSAFAHKGGPHVNAVRKNPRTFEHIDPSAVGNKRRILISELSGGTNILMKAIELGIGKIKSVREARKILTILKDLEGQGYVFEAADASFHLLIQKILKEHKSFFELEGFRVIVEKRSKDEPCLSEATIKVRVNKELEQTVAEGNGPVNALDAALRKALSKFYPAIAKVALTDFHVAILDPENATGATTRVLIESSDGKETWGTVGVSQNIIEASWQALVDSVEYKLFKEEKHKHNTVRKHKR